MTRTDLSEPFPVLKPEIKLPEPAAPTAPAVRLRSLDVFRGATIAGMLLVNNPGSWSHMYEPLGHAPWHGCTPTDLIFPFFLFVVGVAIPFSTAKRLAGLNAQGKSRGSMMKHIAIRAGILFGLGLMLVLVPSSRTNGIFGLETVRIPGVLQRIALCYLFAATVVLFVGWRLQLLCAVLLMALNAWLLLSVQVGDVPRGSLAHEANLAGWVDGKVLGYHVSERPMTPAKRKALEDKVASATQPVDPEVVSARKELESDRKYFFDPEGIVSTIPAIATTLLGALVGAWLRSDRSAYERVAGLFAAGVVTACIGYTLDHALMPINKKLWTPSYVVYTAGLAMLGLGFCFWLVDIKGYRKPTFPFVVFGMNAIAAFVLAGLVGRLMPWTGFRPRIIEGINGALASAGAHMGDFGPWLSTPNNQSLAFALCFVAVFFVIFWVLYLFKIFIKI